MLDLNQLHTLALEGRYCDVWSRCRVLSVVARLLDGNYRKKSVATQILPDARFESIAYNGPRGTLL